MRIILWGTNDRKGKRKYVLYTCFIHQQRISYLRMGPELADLTASGIARSFLAFCDNSEIHSIRFTRVKLSNPDVMDLSKEYTDMPISMEIDSLS